MKNDLHFLNGNKMAINLTLMQQFLNPIEPYFNKVTLVAVSALDSMY